MTVPYCATKLGRRSIGVELNGSYFDDGVEHVRSVDREIATPTLFDLIGSSAEQEEATA